jgi:hypothetical protein
MNNIITSNIGDPRDRYLLYFSLVIDGGMLFFTDFAVSLRDRAEMVGGGTGGQVAVVGWVFALADVELFAKNDLSSRRPVTGC